jgi:hypothetical protein
MLDGLVIGTLKTIWASYLTLAYRDVAVSALLAAVLIWRSRAESPPVRLANDRFRPSASVLPHRRSLQGSQIAMACAIENAAPRPTVETHCRCSCLCVSNPLQEHRRWMKGSG